GADPAALQVVADVKVVQQRSPLLVLVEDRVGEADDGTVALGDDRAFVRPVWLVEPVRPYLEPVREYFVVEEGIRVCAAVVAPPAIGMQRSDRFDVLCGRFAVGRLDDALTYGVGHCRRSTPPPSPSCPPGAMPARVPGRSRHAWSRRVARRPCGCCPSSLVRLRPCIRARRCYPTLGARQPRP